VELMWCSHGGKAVDKRGTEHQLRPCAATCAARAMLCLLKGAHRMGIWLPS